MAEKPKEILQLNNVKKYFSVKGSLSKTGKRTLKAVDDVSFSVHEGEVLGLVGESGCGKSTLGRTVLRLHSVSSGEVIFKGEHIEKYSTKEMRPLRKDMQMIFQDPFASLNPRMTIYQSVKATLDVFKLGTETEKRERAIEMMQQVGLGVQYLDKYPHEMSGGQRQRVVIARAMISNPSFVVCDEPVSALDVSVRSQVLNLMREMQRNTNVAYLFISHDLSVVKYICDRVAVMYLGHIVEIADYKELFEHPVHPYTKALLSAIPIPEVTVKRKRIILQGDVPSPINPPSGCPFHTRCPYATTDCRENAPKLTALDGGSHHVACLRAKELD